MAAVSFKTNSENGISGYLFCSPLEHLQNEEGVTSSDGSWSLMVYLCSCSSTLRSAMTNVLFKAPHTFFYSASTSFSCNKLQPNMLQTHTMACVITSCSAILWLPELLCGTSMMGCCRLCAAGPQTISVVLVMHHGTGCVFVKHPNEAPAVPKCLWHSASFISAE